MKKLLLIISFCVFQISNSQIIPIPDANFKTFLISGGEHGNANATNLAGNPTRVDTNFDNQISIQEAANIGSLGIYNNLPVANLSGLEFFTNLKNLAVVSSTLTSFNFPTLINLESLTLNIYSYYSVSALLNSSLSVINLDGNINLKSLYAFAGNTTGLNLSSNTNLEDLYLLAGNITSLDLTNNRNLKTLYLESGNIANLNLAPNNANLKDINLTVQSSNFNIATGSIYVKNLTCNFIANSNVNLNVFPKLFQLYCYGLGLTTLNTSNNLMLAGIYIDGANLTTLDFNSNLNLENISVLNSNLKSININNLQYVRNLSLADNKLTSLDLSNLINLNSFSVKNNLLTQLSLKNNFLEIGGFDFSGNPTLQSICCDANEIVYVQNQCNFLDYTNTIVSSNCSSFNLSTQNTEFTENRVSLYPNPTSNFLNIESNSIIDLISVSDINGRFVTTKLIDSNKVDVQDLQSGIYFLQITSNSKIKTLKFVKQ